MSLNSFPVKVLLSAAVLTVCLFLMPWWAAAILGLLTFVGLEKTFAVENNEQTSLAAAQQKYGEVERLCSRVQDTEIKGALARILRILKTRLNQSIAKNSGGATVHIGLDQIRPVVESFIRYEHQVGITESDPTRKKVASYLNNLADRLWSKDREEEDAARDNLRAILAGEVAAQVEMLEELDNVLYARE